ncbi:MAG: PEP-CTERM sorting domain-containing protein [Gemmatimonadota bacterium]
MDPSAGINGGLAAGDTYTFTFALTGLDGTTDLNTCGFALHGQGGYNGCSTKLAIDEGGIQNQGPYDPECLTPITTTPEPETMTLLATGRPGGAGFVRRRRKHLS